MFVHVCSSYVDTKEHGHVSRSHGLVRKLNIPTILRLMQRHSVVFDTPMPSPIGDQSTSRPVGRIRRENIPHTGSPLNNVNVAVQFIVYLFYICTTVFPTYLYLILG